MSSSTTSRRNRPRVHGAWTHRWWAGDAALEALLGPAPSVASLDAAAARIDRCRPPGGWPALLRPSAGPLPADALVVLAGQQPVLAGGPGLVAHKAATALRLARDLAQRWSRPVLPVFLLATDDHDSGEVDHVDYVSTSNDVLQRIRCRIQPAHDSFHRCRWDMPRLETSISTLATVRCTDNISLQSSVLAAAFQGACDAGFASHVGNLLLSAFEEAEPPLRTLEAHRLTARAGALLARALAETDHLRDLLAAGARRSLSAGLRASFEAADPRPLLLESREGRRRRLDARDTGAAARIANDPTDFSPHAALRPVVQAATLPVVAQICGPSELAYLGQARGLHAHFGVEPPVLVPRLEATCVPEADLRAAGCTLEQFTLDEGGRDPRRVEEAALDEAARSFAAAVADEDPALRARAERLAERIRRDARRLAESLEWRGRIPPGRTQHLRPRGRPQDTVLAWLPEAWAHGDPAAWGRRIVDMAQPLDPPAHVLYVAPQGGS